MTGAKPGDTVVLTAVRRSRRGGRSITTADLDLSDVDWAAARDQVADEVVTATRDGRLRVEIGCLGFRWLRLNTAARRSVPYA